mgnify:CR=1 FL=1
MALDNGKLRQIYTTLQKGGYNNDYNTFVSVFSGNNNYQNRKYIYDLLTAHGEKVGSSYEEFMSFMQQPKQQPKQQQQARPAARQNPGHTAQSMPWGEGLGALSKEEGNKKVVENAVDKWNFSRMVSQAKPKPQPKPQPQRSYVSQLTPTMNTIYDILKDAGEKVGSVQQFQSYFERGYGHRKAIYDKLVKLGAFDGSYNEFAEVVGLKPKNALTNKMSFKRNANNYQINKEVREEATLNAVKDNDYISAGNAMLDSTPTQADEIDSDELQNSVYNTLNDVLLSEQRTDLRQKGVGFTNSNIDNGRAQLKQDGFDPVINSQIKYLGKVYDRLNNKYLPVYQTTDGKQYHEALTADKAQRYIDVTSMPYRETELRRRKQELEDAINKRGSEIDRATPTGYALGGVAAMGLGSAATPNNAGFSRLKDTDYLTLQANLKEVDEALGEIEEAKKGLASDKWIANSNGDFERFGKRLFGYFGGSYRGFMHSIGKVSTWDFGLSDIEAAMGVARAVRKADKVGFENLSKEQQKLLNDAAQHMMISQEYAHLIGRGYKAGQVTAESLPFMLEMIVNPASSMGKAAQQKVVRSLIKKFGKDAIRKSAQKYLLKKYGARVVGDALGASVMASTTGSGRVYADTRRRMTGDLNYNVNESGEAYYDGHEKGESFVKAFAKAFGAQAIENHSEMLGEYIKPLLGVVGKTAYKGLTKATAKNLYTRFGVNKVRGMINDVMSTPFAKFVSDLESRAKWNGMLGEYAEEVIGNVENALLVGDNTLDADENTGVFDLDQNIDTFLGVALMGGFVSSVKTGYYLLRGKKRLTLNEMNKAGRAIDSAFSGNIQLMNTWGGWRNTILLGTDEEKKSVLREILDNKSIPMNVRMRILDYAKSAQEYQGIVKAQQIRRYSSDEASVLSERIDNSADEGYEATNEQKNAIRRAYRRAKKKFDSVFGEQAKELLALDENELFMLTDEMTTKKANAIYDYLDSKSKYEGMLYAVQDKVNDAVDDSNKSIDERTHTDGTLIKATMNVDDRQVYIVNGNIVLRDDGSIDMNNSDKSIVIVDAETNKREMVAPSAFKSVDTPVSAEEVKAKATQEVTEQISREESDIIEGKLDFNVGDTYDVVDQNENQFSVQIVEDKGDNVVVQINGQQTEMAKADVQKMYDDYVQLQDEAEDNKDGNAEAQEESQSANELKEGSYVSINGVEYTIAEISDNNVTLVDSNGKRIPWSKSALDAKLKSGDAEVLKPMADVKVGDVYMDNDGDSFTITRIEDNNVYVADSNGVEYEEPYEISVITDMINAGMLTRKENENASEAEDNASSEAEDNASSEGMSPASDEEQNNESDTPISPTEDATPATSEPQNEPMPMKTVGKGKNARQQEDWLSTTPKRGYDYLFNEVGLKREEAKGVLDAYLAEAQKKLDAERKKEVKFIANVQAYKEKKIAHEQRITELQAEVDYWKSVKDEYMKVLLEEKRERDAKDAADHDQAVEDELKRKEDEARKKAEAEARGSNAVSAEIRDKWNEANKIVGAEDEVTLPNGETITGHYILVESGAATPSHQSTNGFEETEGFPVDQDGKNVNDRDYKRDKEAQQITLRMGENYDQRAIQSPIVVSQDGVVLSGNGRTMAGEIAAQNGTDIKYNDYLRKYGNKYGFTQEQIAAYQHPRVVFVPDVAMPYNSETFAKFNQREQKSQNRTETAVKMGKLVSDDLFGRVMSKVNEFSTLGEFYANDKATTEVIKELAAAGVIPQTEMAGLFDGGKLSEVGQGIVEGVMIGKAFQANPDAVRQITEIKSMRQAVMTALQDVAINNRLGNGYDLSNELAAAIDLVYKARKAGFQLGQHVSQYAHQGNLFQLDDGATVADFNNAAVMMLADVLNDKRVTILKQVISSYNAQAENSSQGIGDLLSGGAIRSKEEIINEINQLYNNGQEYNRTAETASDRQGRGSQGSEQGTVDSESNSAGKTRELANEFNALATELNTAEGEERMRVLGEMRDCIAHFAEENGYPVPEFLLTREDFLAAVPEKDRAKVEQWLDDGWHCPAYYEKGKVYYFVEGCDNFDKDVSETLSHEYTHADNAEYPENVNALTYAVEDTHEVSQDELIDILETLSNSSHYEEKAERLESEGKNSNPMLADEVIAHAVSLMVVNGEQTLDGITKNPTLQFIIKRAYKVRENERRHNILASETSERSSNTSKSSEANSGNSQSVAEGESKLGRYGRSTRSETNLGRAEGSADRGQSGIADSKQSVEKGGVTEEGTPLSSKIEAASAKVNTEPTEAQKEAGNYKKGHVQVGTFDITIEQPQGSVRKGTDADGKHWESKMNNTYGYIRGAVGVDGDHIDVFLSNDIDGWNGRKVFVVDQYNPDGSFDEHKVMLGFNEADEAKSDYLANYEKGWEDGRRIDVSAVNLEDFEKWIASSKRKTKPFGEYSLVKKTDNQGNPLNADGTLKLEKVKSVDDLTDEDFSKPTRSVALPSLPAMVDDAIGAKGKTIIIKKNIFEKNKKNHNDLSASQSREILTEALYHPDLYGQNQKTKRPYNWILIHNAVKHSSVILEVNHNKDNVEIVNWHYLDDKALKQKERQAIDEGGLILTLESAAGNAINNLSYDGKGKEKVSSEQGNVGEKDVNGKNESVRQQKADIVGAESMVASKPSKSEVALRDAVIDHLRENGMDVITDEAEGQRVLDMANEADVRFGAKQKRALETATIAEQSTNNATVVSSADGAKVQKILETLADNYEKRSNKTRGFITDLSRSLGLVQHEASQYGTFETRNGKLVTIRVSNHNARVSFFDENGEEDGISIVISSHKNKGVLNDGKAHLVEYFYPKQSLERSGGKPLADIVKCVSTVLESGKFEDTTGLAQRQEVNAQQIREHRVYHGSGAEFDAFDHSHMGEGEGSQSFGWGTYVTNSETIGKSYANRAKADFGLQRNELESDISRAKEQLPFVRGEVKEELEAKIRDWETKLENFDNGTSLYTVEIPEDNGKNYLDWRNSLPDGFNKEAVKERIMQENRTDDEFENEMLERDLSDSIDYATTGMELYKAISLYIGDKAASKMLYDMGFVGIKYPAGSIYGGVKEGDTNYVIFNEKDAQITDHVRFFRTANGEAYGFTIGGKIYIDPKVATSETPVHEYAHLWATALKTCNPKEWQNIVSLMKGTSVWNEVKKLYPELKSDDEIADEVLATYSGRRGAERLREEMKKAAAEKGNIYDKAAAVNTLQRVKQAIDKFWKAVADFLHIHYESAEQVADQVMKDLLNGVDPRSMMDGGKTLRPDTRINVVEGNTEHGFKNYAEAKDWAKKQIARTYSSEETGGKGDIRISNAAINKYLSQSAVDKSDSKDVHLSVLKVLPEVIRESVDAEQHADYKKGEDGVRSAKNGINPNVTIHRLYGAVRMGGRLYRVKVTLKEDKTSKEPKVPHSYEATKIELFAGTLGNSDNSLSPNTNNSITAAKLLNGVEKSYDGGKFFEDYNKVREQFIGEQGAERADHAEEVSTRLDNLSVAREMEAEKKDAKAIKMATGWERGADGKWRYEIADMKEFDRNGNLLYRKHHPDYARYIELQDKDLNNLFEDGEELTDKEREEYEVLSKKYESDKFGGEKLDNNHTLEAYVDAPELFKAYPELKDVGFRFEDTGGNEIASYRYISSVFEVDKDDVGEIVVNTGKVSKNTRTREVKSAVLHEIQHAIQEIEGFARGGNPKSMQERFEAAKKEWRARAWADALRDKADEMGEHYNQAAVEKALIDEYKEMGMDNDEWMPNKEIRIKGFNYFARGYSDRSMDADIKNFRLAESTRADFSPYVEYSKLGGEVESRNVEHRMNMTPEERSASLAAETEDVSREDQIFLFGNNEGGSYSLKDGSAHLGRGKNVGEASDAEGYTEFANQYGVDAEVVKDYASGMKTGNLQKAEMALAEIRRTMRVANRGMKLSEFGKLFRPVQNELTERYGDIEKLRQEYIDAVMRERGVMEAARKRAEEEEAKRKAHLEEMSLLSTEELDKRYFDAIENGDDATAREMLDEAARRKGYDDTESDYQGVGAWSAPENPGYESDKARRDDLEYSGSTVNLEDIALGYTPLPDDYFYHPEYYSMNTPHGLESVKVINAAIDAIKNGEKGVKVKVYRAVPTSVKEGKLRNGDWVTPSKKYAEMHGNGRLEGKYRIIEDEVPANELWWDGNDGNEWGFDDGRGYKYKNVENNRKLNDLVTRDDNGEIIPPSKRFDENVEDVRYREGKSPKAQMKQRVKEWLSSENLQMASGKTREEIFEQFGNNLEPIAIVPKGYLRYLGNGFKNNAVYCGMGYMIDHAVNHHAEEPIENYEQIQDILDYPDVVKLDNRKKRTSLIFIKKYDKFQSEVISVDSEEGKLVVHKTFYHKRNMPQRGLPNVAIESPSEDEITSISHSPNREPASLDFSALDGHGKGTDYSNTAQHSSSEKALHFIEALQPHAGTTITDEEPMVLKGEEALTALENIFNEPTSESLPSPLSTLENFREVFSRHIRTFLGELVKVKDEVFNKIIRERRANISGAILSTIENADFAIRDTDGSTLYVKRYKSDNSGNTYNVVAVNKHGEVEDYVSSVHIKRDGNLRNKIKNGAELLLPQERNTDGNLSRNNSTPAAKVVKDFGNSQLSPSEKSKHQVATDLARQMHIEGVVDVLESSEGLSGRKARAKGWFDPVTGRITIVLSKNENAADVARTIFHEAAAHLGLRELVGKEHYDTFLDNIYNNAEKRIQDEIKKKADEKYKGDLRRATDEYMAELAEDGEFVKQEHKSFLQQIKDSLISMLRKVGIKLGFELNDNDLRYILWRSWKNLAEGNARNIYQMAEDARMQDRLLQTPESQKRHEQDILLREANESIKNIVEDTKKKLEQLNEDKKSKRKDAVELIGGQLSKLHEAMRVQREYDMHTVASITELAQAMLKIGMLKDLSNNEANRILSVVKNVHGKRDISQYVQNVFDIMIDNQLKNSNAQLTQLLMFKGKKKDARGVEVQGKLDVEGQRIADVVWHGLGMSDEALNNLMSDLTERMNSSSDVIARNAKIDYAACELLKQYNETIRDSKSEEKELRASLAAAKEDLDAGNMEHKAYLQYRDEVHASIRENKMERIEAYQAIVNRLGGMYGESMECAKQWREAEIERVKEIHHNANSDMEGRPCYQHYKPTAVSKAANSSFLYALTAPLGTFEEMLRMFGNKNVRGEGYLWNRYMRGFVDARNNEVEGYWGAMQELDDKVAEVFGKGKKWSDLFSIERKLPKGEVRIKDGNEVIIHELPQGNLLYIYMVNKMSDGRMKLRKMDITEATIEDIESMVDPKLKKIADWLQDEFLVKRREKYNKVHERMFGASMAAIDNYFPLKILKNAIAQNTEIENKGNDNDRASTITGSIKKRTRNSLALDIMNADAFSVVIDHIKEMEHWAAFAEWNRDLNTLLSYKRFRNQVINMSSVYGAGNELLSHFEKVCQIAAGVYKPSDKKFDKVALNIAKGVTGAKVTGRVFTAFKQLTSYPAYLSDANPLYLANNLLNPAATYEAWKWSMENLPMLRERFQGRFAGDPLLMSNKDDWSMWRSKVAEFATKYGMAPNAFVDALTISMGTHAVYKTKLAKYLRMGYSEEQADKRAKQDATISYNMTQQSSEGAFMSMIQSDRTWITAVVTAFRNSSISYTRMTYNALRNTLRRFKPGYRGMSEEFMAKQMEREGIDPNKASEYAKREYRLSVIRDFVTVGVFAYILPFVWNLTAYTPYLLFGDDDDKKKDMWSDIFTHTMFGSVEGLALGDMYSATLNSLYRSMFHGEDFNANNFTKDLPFVSDINTMVKDFQTKEWGVGLTDVINIMIQSGIGINPQTLTDAVVAIYDYCGADEKTPIECALLIMRIMNCPQSQMDKIYFDELDMTGAEAKQLKPAEIAKRYAEYKAMREAPIRLLMPDDSSAKARNFSNAEKRAKEDVNAKLQTEETKQLLNEYKETAKKLDEIGKLKDEDEDAYIKQMQNIKKSDEYKRYKIVGKFKAKSNKFIKIMLNSENPEERKAAFKQLQEFRDSLIKSVNEI